MRHIETDSLSNQNIATALAIGAYTSDGDRLIVVDVCVDAIAGNGDYVMYVTKQIGGAGSAYVILPKTTMAAAAGETAIGGQSGLIAVRSGDILTVYVKGLAGDTTTPDTTVRFFETESDVKLAATQTGVTIPTVTTLTNAPTGMALEATLTAIKGAGWTTQTLVAMMTAINLILEDTGTDIPALITALSAWQATNVNSGVTNGLITQIRGDSWDFDIDPVTLDSNKQQFCIKEKSTDLDSESILFMDNITGLLYLNGAAATASDATLTYTGTKLNIKLNAEASAQLPVGKFHYGAQYKTAAGIVKEPYGGIFTISSDLVLATE